ncbi:MAG: hypothetical protein GX927_09010 [Lentisphaerae bacterium]|nr:hypothetical protein [Lentisphaerota bacterium]
MELKYLVFFFFLMLVIPGSFLAAMDYRLLTAGVFLMIFVPVWFQATSIEFFTVTAYRGTSRGMEISIVYLTALMVCLGLLIRGFKFHLLAPGLLPFIILFFFSGLSIINAEDLMISFFELWKMVMMLLVYLAIYNYLLASRNFEVIIAGMSALILYSFVLVIKEKYFGVLWQARGIFPHQNSMAMYLGLIGPVFLAGWVNTRSLLRGYLFALLFMITTASTISSYSRGAIICYPLGCAVTLVLSLRYHFSIRKMQIAMLVVVVGMLITLLFLPTVVLRFVGAPEASKITRIELAQAAWNMMRDKFLGVGVNNWNLKMRPPYKYSIHHEADVEMEARGFLVNRGIVETVYLLIGAECGWIALGALLWWFVLMFLMNYRLLSIYEKHELFYLPAGFAGGLLATYAQSLFEWVLKQAINFAQLMVVFAIISALYYMRHTLPSETPVLLLREDF